MKQQFAYDSSVEPAAPMMACRFAHAASGKSMAMAALLDTGADLTVLPQAMADELDLTVRDRRTVSGVDGMLHGMAVAAVSVAFAGRSFEIVALISYGETTPLLGRDVLNQHRLTVDGPNLLLEVDD